MSLDNRIDVEIFNQRFTLSSDGIGEEKIRKIAQFVDQKMREIYKITQISSFPQLAILTALNLAEQLLSLQEKTLTDDSDIVERILSLSQRMQALIEENSSDE